MTEAVFAREEVKEFPDEDIFSMFTFIHEIFPWFPEDFFMRYSPRNTCDGNRTDKQQSNLVKECIHKESWAKTIPPYQCSV